METKQPITFKGTWLKFSNHFTKNNSLKTWTFYVGGFVGLILIIFSFLIGATAMEDYYSGWTSPTELAADFYSVEEVNALSTTVLTNANPLENLFVATLLESKSDLQTEVSTLVGDIQELGEIFNPQWVEIPETLGNAQNLDGLMQALDPEEFGYDLLLFQNNGGKTALTGLIRYEDSTYVYKGDYQVQYSFKAGRVYYCAAKDGTQYIPVNVSMTEPDSKLYGLALTHAVE